MVGTLRAVLLEKGHDPRDFSLVGFGGAGPLHVNELMELENIPRGIIPQHPGQFSALGFTMTDARVDRERTIQQLSSTFDIIGSNQLLKQLEELTVEEIRRNGVDEFEITRSIDLRYSGQNYELTLDYEENEFTSEGLKRLWQSFHDLHQSRFNFSIPGETIEIVNLAISVISKTQKRDIASLRPGKGQPDSLSEREVWFENKLVSTPVFDRADFLCGHSVDGPAIIREKASTTVLSPNYFAEVDVYGNLHISQANEV